MPSPNSSTARRSVHFDSFEELLDEAKRCAERPHRVAGRWSCGQILEHLAMAIEAFYDGFGFQAPWWARTFVAPFLKRHVLTNGMSPGIRLPKTAASLLPPDDASPEQGLARLQAAIDRLQCETPTQPHPFFGRMRPDEVRQLMLRHAELHLSFITPE